MGVNRWLELRWLEIIFLSRVAKEFLKSVHKYESYGSLCVKYAGQCDSPGISFKIIFLLAA